MIKVAMIGRSTLFSIPGGDTVQIQQTAKHLSQNEVKADIFLSNQLIPYEQYDLLHFFNIIRPADILFHIQNTNKPFVVSPVFVDYSEYDKKYRKGMSGLLFRLLGADAIEYTKYIGRVIFNGERPVCFSYLLKGHNKSIKSILKKAAFLLPNSVSEYERLKKKYRTLPPMQKVVNGVDQSMFRSEPAIKENDLVVCAARIEGIKNQLNLIKALSGSRYTVLLIGSPAPNQMNYYNRCKKNAGSNIHFIPHISQEELLLYYRRAKVHVLPSFFETTGLSSLEAGAMGCNIVITDKGDTKEYFNDDAFYCDPASPASIAAAVEKAARSPANENLMEKILLNYNWQQATASTVTAYRTVIQLYDTKNRNSRNAGNS